jgi:hypothetical protein
MHNLFLVHFVNLYIRGSQFVLRVHFPGAPRPLQENKINKNWMKLKNKKQKVESK